MTSKLIAGRLIPIVVLFLLGDGGLWAANAVTPTVVKISAKRYEFTPQEIVLKKGVPAILQLTTEDRSHGLSIPSLNVRTDILPGKVTELKVTPDKAGEFDFFCDVFCGSGHEGMSGKIKVQE